VGKTTIEWTWRTRPDGRRIPGYTRNLVWGCVKVSEGCKYCYAEAFAERLGLDLWGPRAERRTFGDGYWQEPLRWNAQAEHDGYRRNVFCSSMADTFEDHPVVEQERQRRLWPLIATTPWLNWLLLTKRPENMLRMAPWQDNWPDNVWVMTSVETQRRADERVPLLLNVPAVIRGLSIEPQLEHINVTRWLDRLQWVIVGGESGPNARPFDPDWARALRAQCAEAGVAFFFKQYGGMYHNTGGRLLDGRTWNEMPVPVMQARQEEK
jgi:protein gp37